MLPLSAITALSPLDGRYEKKVAALRETFSEFALIKMRIHVEVEWLIERDPHTIKMRCAKKKGPWCVGKAAGAIFQRWLKNTRIGAFLPEVTRQRTRATRGAGDGTKGTTEAAPQNIGRFTGRKVNRLARFEMKSKRD